MVGTPVVVGLAEVQAINGAAMLTCLGLGSCVTVCCLDPIANISGMAHIVLPKTLDEEAQTPGTFADTGVPELFRRMEEMGAERSRMVCAVAGGASPRIPEHFQDIGRKTAEAVIEQIKNFGVKCIAADLGGHIGRTVTMVTDSGEVFVSTAHRGESMLCSLRG